MDQDVHLPMTLSRERKGIGSENWQEEKPMTRVTRDPI